MNMSTVVITSVCYRLTVPHKNSSLVNSYMVRLFPQNLINTLFAPLQILIEQTSLLHHRPLQHNDFRHQENIKWHCEHLFHYIFYLAVCQRTEQGNRYLTNKVADM